MEALKVDGGWYLTDVPNVLEVFILGLVLLVYLFILVLVSE